MTNYQKFLMHIKKSKFLEGHQRILLALSGGQDSMTLYQWLLKAKDELNFEFGVAHVNYGLRDQAEAEERALSNLTDQDGIPFYTRRFTGKFTELTGRDFRYAFFKEIMAHENYSLLMTAHHRNDNEETVFMRLLTGRRLRHLTGIQSVQKFGNGFLVRPLLIFDKEELTAEKFWLDGSNQSPNYLRNRIRNEYFPLLMRENPKFGEALSNLTEEIQQALSIIDSHIDSLHILGESIDLTDFLLQSQPLQSFVLQSYLERFTDLQLTKGTFEDCLHILRKPGQYHEKISSAYFLVKTAEKFWFSKTDVKELGLEILGHDPKDTTFMRIDLPQDQVFQVRRREAGDQILIRSVHRKLKQVFIDEQVSLADRERPLLADGKEILAVPAIGLLSDLSKTAQNAKIKKTIWVRLLEKVKNASAIYRKSFGK